MFKARTKESGFSLIEVSIALVVISLIATGLLLQYRVYSIQRKEGETKSHIELVRTALAKYAAHYGHYPRPADRNIAPGNIGFGKEVATPPTTVCSAATDNIACIAGPVGSEIYIGDVPFATLGILYKNMVDAYGSKLTYAVTKTLTTAGYTENGGAINVINELGANLYTGTTPKAHFFIFSPGPDRVGAFSLNGTKLSPCPTAGIIPSDAENCNNDTTFRSNVNAAGQQSLYFPTGANHFDDVATYINSTANGLWSLVPNSGALVSNNTNGNILIGAPVFTYTSAGCGTVNCVQPPLTTVDVYGNVAGQKLLTNRLCTNAAGCTDPATASPALPTFPAMLTPNYFTTTPNLTPPASNLYSPAGNVYVSQGNGVFCPNNMGLKGFFPSSAGYLDEECTGAMQISNPSTLNSGGSTSLGCGGSTPYAIGIDTAGRLKCGS